MQTITIFFMTLIIIAGLLLTIALLFATQLHQLGWRVHLQLFNYAPSASRTNFSFYLLPRVGLGYYSTGWFKYRQYGDGIPDQRRSGHYKAPSIEKRSRQIGLDIIWLCWGFMVAFSNDQQRSI